MADNVFSSGEPRENLLPIHPSCGHRLASLGCRTHHRGLGEPEPVTPSETISAEQAAMVANVEDGYLVTDVVDTEDGPRVRYRATAKGRRRAEQLLGLPAGSLDDTEEGPGLVT